MEEKLEARIRHLEMIQTNINRMASNSFKVKGWSVTSIGAMYAFWLTNKNQYLLFLILGVTILFWLHDAYYLMLERGFRNLYDEVRESPIPSVEDMKFEMGPKKRENLCCVALLRPILSLPYGLIVVLTMTIIYIMK